MLGTTGQLSAITMRRIFQWLGLFWYWFAEARLLWMALLVLLLAFLVSFRSGAGEIHIRVTGLILQWLGIGTVALGIHETRRLFGRPGIVKLLLEWMSHFPRWRRRIVVGAGSGTLRALTGHAGVHVWSNVDPSASIEARLEALTKNVERVNERLIQAQREIDSALSKQSEALHQEQHIRAKDDENLHKRLEAAETGGLHISFIGMLWIFFGLLLSTMSAEIAQWVK